MMYVEFIERDRWVPIEIFRQLGNQGSAWADGATDRMVLQLGRTLRFGPRPSYLCFWEIPGIGRLDAWEAYFQSAAAKENSRSLAMHRAINIDRAGLYDVVIAGPSDDSRLYAVEFLDRRASGSPGADDAVASMRERGISLLGREPLYLLERIGRVGPGSSHLCVWPATDYTAIEPLLRSPLSGELETSDVGIYRGFGHETL